MNRISQHASRLDIAPLLCTPLVSIVLLVGAAHWAFADPLFGPKRDFTTGNGPYSVAIGDFNGDGKQDLAVAISTSGTVSILPGYGNGTFGARADFATGSGPYSVAVGDFNRDGKQDLAVANSASSTISVLLGNGAGTFGAKADFATGSGPYSIAVGDFNGDGKQDLAVANSTSSTVSVLLGNGDGTFGAKADFATGTSPYFVAVGDFNGDGQSDLVATNHVSGTVSVLLGNQSVTSWAFAAKADFATERFPYKMAAGDFNRDGRIDLVVTKPTDYSCGSAVEKVSVLLGLGDGTLGATTEFETGSCSFSVAVGDFNRDGKLDLAVTSFVSNTVSVLLGNGNGAFGAKADFATGSGPYSVAVGDFNGDGKPDLVVGNYGDGTVSVLLGNGDGTFGPKADFGTGAPGGDDAVAVGDFNRDGKPDLVVAMSNSGTVSVLLGNGNGTFGAKADFMSGGSPIAVAVGDFNGDGKQDLAVANATSPVSVLLGNGNGTFGAKADFTTGKDPRSVAVGDFNRDGKPDLAVANYNYQYGGGSTGSVSVLLGNGNGAFGAKADFVTGENPTSVVVGDFNGDGKPDLAVANYRSNTISVLLNVRDTTRPIVVVGSPNGGETWAEGSSHSITWTAADNIGVDSVNVDYSLGGPAGPWFAVGHSLPNSGTTSWILPSQASDSVIARVTAFDHALNAGSDVSDGFFRIVPTSVGVGEKTAVFALARPTPNPSSGSLRLRFSLEREGAADLEIMDVAGSRVWKTRWTALSEGEHSVVWDGRTTTGAPTGGGMYFLRLRAPSGTRTMKLVRVK